MENTNAFPKTRRCRSKKRIPAIIVMCVCFALAILCLVIAIEKSAELSDLRTELSAVEQRETQSEVEQRSKDSQMLRLKILIEDRTRVRTGNIAGIVIILAVGAFVGGLLFHLARETERRVEARRQDQRSLNRWTSPFEE